MPENEVVQFDPRKLKDKVAETVRDRFGELIPDDEWQRLVDAEIHAFFEHEGSEWTLKDEYTGSSGYSDNRIARMKAKLTPFRAQVWTLINELVQAKLKTTFEDQFKAQVSIMWSEFSNENFVEEVQPHALMEKMMEQMIPLMVQQMFKGAFAGFFNTCADDISAALIARLRNQGM